MRDAYYSVYRLIDELYELYPEETEDIKAKFPNYHGEVCVFTDLSEFGIYEMTDGDFWNIINFDSPYAKLIHLEEIIDFNEIASNVLKAGFKNVIDHGDVIYVLTEMNA